MSNFDKLKNTAKQAVNDTLGEMCIRDSRWGHIFFKREQYL